MTPLADSLRSCGPVVDEAAAERLRAELTEAAAEDGWSVLLEAAWPAIRPVAGAAPYLAGLMRRWPQMLRGVLETAPAVRLEAILSGTAGLSAEALDVEAFKRRLRLLKAELHLLTALADLGGVWDLDRVTEALTRFADASVHACLAFVASGERARGRLLSAPGEAGPIPGLFGLAMGKYGAFELNYSSDIDLSLFYEPEALEIAEHVEAQAFVNRVAQQMTNLLSDRTVEGYVFRLDLRLRPDPSSTPPVVAVSSALTYYETVGQNWERAAFIKARPGAGDLPRARTFLNDLKPYVWRRSLDYGAVSDIHSIKRQIHVFRADERLEAAGANLKLGAGGIREVEFFVQTQQLILGGRDASLRSPRTLEALQALVAAGHVAAEAAADLDREYRRLRGLEHRIQMLQDEQTHILPEDAEARRRVAALAGEGDLAAFDASVSETLKRVNRRYGDLFAGEEALSSSAGSLVFTGVEDDPETLLTLERMGFSDPVRVSQTIRAWHHGRIPATRTERGRELFTRLAPRLLEALSGTGVADAAFARFSVFFSGLSSGVQVQSLFLAQPALFELVVRVLALAPRLAGVLARRPAALDSLLDARFFMPLGENSGVCDEIVESAAQAQGFEAAMDAVRRIWREQAFRVGVQILSGRATPGDAGAGFADLADACVQGLAPAAMAETVRLGGAFPGRIAVLGLGKLGSREMTTTSDLDLMTVYEAEPGAVSAAKGWMAETFFGRFTQRLIAALSAPTAEGTLFEIDMQLRPTGAKGPVAVSLPGFEGYYETEADVWEFLALTRARVVWASDPAFGTQVAEAVERALRRPRDPVETARQVLAMRDLMERERPAGDFWDLKLSPGGLVDAEFAAQYLQIAHASKGAPLRSNTLEALAALGDAGLAEAADLDVLSEAWALQQGLSQLLRAALDERQGPESEPEAFKQLLADAGGAGHFGMLRQKLESLRSAARASFERTLLRNDGISP
ncbi:MAG: bifunctional [glutamine synthetase] adenylyltransferase/[glutamine synthetase]-adenylyl-L-tyrosine phosphorylase [Caulobacteraceae bacterium]|nr:bifunctional [glutamine synthetase] adenylyltransferase/[glutamine synthetase]-adenylyl-L-tyrosine phosphorylase [Caulobacteraceae bacterium]